MDKNFILQIIKNINKNEIFISSNFAKKVLEYFIVILHNLDLLKQAIFSSCKFILRCNMFKKYLTQRCTIYN